MTREQIQSLLSRFYEGQTTPDEERLLAAYFQREDIPEELQEDKQLFLMLAQISDQEMPTDIAEEITAFVNNLGQTEKKPVLSDLPFENTSEDVVSSSSNGGYSFRNRRRCVISSANIHN